METDDANPRDFQKRLWNDLREAHHDDEVGRERRDLLRVIPYSFYFFQQGRGAQIVEGPKPRCIVPRLFIEHEDAERDRRVRSQADIPGPSARSSSSAINKTLPLWLISLPPTPDCMCNSAMNVTLCYSSNNHY